MFISIGYKKVANENWTTILTSDRHAIFSGNKDRNTIVENIFMAPILAKVVRLYPEQYFTHPALRWDLYGCGTYTI